VLIDSAVVLNTGGGASGFGELVGVGGFDLGLAARNRSKNAGVDDFGGFLAAWDGLRAAKSAADGFECAGGRK
jgi:hypothetical protein